MLILQSSKETYRTKWAYVYGYMVGGSLKDDRNFPGKKIPANDPSRIFSTPFHGFFRLFGAARRKGKGWESSDFPSKKWAVLSDDQNHGWLG